MKKIVIIILLFAVISALFRKEEKAELYTVAKDRVVQKAYQTMKSSGVVSGYEVLYVADGDTFTIRKGKKKVTIRLIGVDTPESVHKTDPSRNTEWGKIASNYTKKALKGQHVFLKYDTQKKDKYGRTLAYVYLKQDGKKIMYNRTLVEKGLARAVCYEPNHRYKRVFNKLQKKAKKAKRGFWKDGYRAAFPRG